MKEVVHIIYGFEKLTTWNFTEAGHVKGAPDRTGCLIKRTADKLLSHGNGISDADKFHHAMKNAGFALDLHMITDDSIFDTDKISSVPLHEAPTRHNGNSSGCQSSHYVKLKLLTFPLLLLKIPLL
jgi:hypothetical protein